MYLVTTTSPNHPILQVNKTGEYTLFPVMLPNTALTTTGMTCKSFFSSTYYNEPEMSYICPENSIPLALNMMVKISKAAAGNFEHLKVLSLPVANDCLEPHYLKASFRRPTASQWVPIITAMAAWLTFAAQTLGLMPYFLGQGRSHDYDHFPANRADRWR